MINTIDFINEFKIHHPTISTIKIIDNKDLNNKLRITLSKYENSYNINFRYYCQFSEGDLKKISNSSINKKLRNINISKKNVVVFTDKSNFENFKLISNIATNQKPSNTNTIKEYRKTFKVITQDYWKKFSNNHKLSTNDYFITPLRAGKFIFESLQEINSINPENNLPIHSKRIYTKNYPSGVALSTLDFNKIMKSDRLIICEGGIVSGITIISILEVLFKNNILPSNIIISSIHSSLYGILNILDYSISRKIDINITTYITSYAIGPSFYAYYDFAPWRKNSLVTGDIGNYLYGKSVII